MDIFLEGNGRWKKERIRWYVLLTAVLCEVVTAILLRGILRDVI